MKHLLRIIRTVLLAAVMTSCGELFDIESVTDEDHPAKMELSRHEMTMMAGDETKLTVNFTPAELNDDDLPVYWMSADLDVVAFKEGVMQAVGAGTTKVYASSVSVQLVDSCEVTVVGPWVVSGRQFSREMMVYANVTVNGKPMTDDMEVGAFCVDEQAEIDELRGVGVALTAANHPYIAIRVYSDNMEQASIPKDFDPYAEPVEKDDEEDDDEEAPNIEVIRFRVYDHKTCTFYELDQRLPFDGDTHGTLSNLFELKNK